MTNAKILLVDDVKVFIEFERGLFERAGCTVLSAASGPEALRLARDERPHAVLLDYEMPGMKGDEVCLRIRGDAVTRHIPVLIVTSHPTPEVEGRCRRAGCTDFIAKPVTARELMQRVLKLLQIPYRVALRTRVRMEVRIDGTDESVSVLGYSIDISEGGMLIEAPEPVAEGRAIRVAFSLPGSEEPRTTRAAVIRSTAQRERGAFTVALKFLEADAATRAAIRSFVEQEIGT